MKTNGNNIFRVIILSLLLLTPLLSLGQTSWRGTVSTAWSNASNWTAGVPNATTNAIIGDASFTGTFQPTISSNATVNSLTISSTNSPVLSVNKNLTISGNLIINAGGSITQRGVTVTVKGNWTNSGSYTTTQNNARVNFAGATQSINGGTTTFRRLGIGVGSVVTFNTNVSVSNALTVSGTFIPAENATPYLVSGGGTLLVDATGILNVTASTFAANYSLTPTLNAGSVVVYSATTANQTVRSDLSYSTLRISGASTVKSLIANLNALVSSTSAAGRIEVLTGTLDLATFTANRGTTVAGGDLVVSSGASLRLSGANFPANYGTRELQLGSTVEYYGDATQVVSAQTYGNLILSGTTGTVVKTLPATAFTIEGNLTSSLGTASSLSFTAGANITINGSVNIGTGTTFNGGSFTIIVSDSWTVAGTFTGATSTVQMSGGGTAIHGTGTHNFNNLTIAAFNITADANASITIGGNLATIEPGTFTHLTGGTLTMSGASKSITGTNIVFDNLVITGSISAANVFEVKGNLTVSGTFNGTNGEQKLTGTSKTISGAGTATFGTLTTSGTITTAISFTINTSLNVSGSFSATAGTITFTGTSILNGTANLYNITINGTSLQLSSNSVMGVANAFTISSGTFDVTSTTPNTVNYNGSLTQTVTAGTYYNLIISNTGVKSAGGAITANGSFSILTGSTFNALTFTHTIVGDLSNSGTFTAGSSNITFSGTSNSAITGATTFNNLTVNKGSANTDVNALNDISALIVNMTSGRIITGTNTLTITNTRNGNGIILGNIRRQHAFTSGTAYAFEGPDNTITMNGTLSLTAITVSVTLGAISDFPSGASINREYTIAKTGTFTLTGATIRLHYEDGELNGNNESSMSLWVNPGSQWITTGKTANSTTSNYVEDSNFPDIDGRFTLSDNASVYRWNGSVSNNWATAGNWTTDLGSATIPPGVNDIVQIGIVSFTNQPVINTSVNVKNVVLGSLQPVSITLATGGSLTIQGNLQGIWAGNASHTITMNNQNLTVNGDISMGDGTSGHNINISSGTGSLTVGGDLTQTTGATLGFTSAGVLSIGGDYNYVSGTFSPGTSTVIYNGSTTQIVAGLTYNNLTVQKASGTAVDTGRITINGDLSVASGEFNQSNVATVAGNVSIQSGAILTVQNTTMDVGGNWTNSGTFSSTGSTVNFTGAAAQNISASGFNNLNINKTSGVATLTGNLLLSGNLTISSGSLNLVTFSVSRAALGGTMSLASGTTLLVGGAANFPANYSVYSINSASTVHYNGTVAQSVSGQNYGNLIFSNGGGSAKVLAGLTTVNGDITINSGATLNGGTFPLSLYGNWINSGTFTPSTNTVTLNGTGKTITGTTTFNRVTVSGSYTVNGSDITYNGLLNVTSTGTFNAGGGLATINGDLTNSGSLTSTGTTTFTGTSLQTIRILNSLVSNSNGIINFNGNVSPVLNSTSSPSFATANINNTAGVTASVGWNVFVAFNVSSGATFNGGGSTHNIFGSFTNNGTVTSSGKLNFTPSTPQTINLSGTGFTSTGTVLFGGTGAITVTGTPTALNTVTISNSAGVSPAANWTLNTDFQITSTGIFNAGSNTYSVAGTVESNGTLNGGTSTFNLSAAAGHIIGSPNTTFYDLNITGAITAESDFNVSHNFNNNGTSSSFTASPGTLVMTGTGASVISGTPTSFALAQLQILKDPSATVTVSKSLTSVSSIDITTGTLDIGSTTITQDVGNLAIEDNARLIIRGNNTLPVFTTYNLDTLSYVEYGGLTQSISNATAYGNLTISTAGSKTATTILKVLNDFTLTNGTFVPGSFADTIGGHWTMTSGTFTATGSTMVFAGTGTQQINSTGAFQNLTVNKTTGFVNLASDNTINGVLNFIRGNIRTGTNKVIIPLAASVTNAGQVTGWVFGYEQKQVTIASLSKTFEIGDSLSYSPASTVFTTVSVGGTITARAATPDHPNIATSGLDPNKSVNRYWEFTNSGITFTTTSVTLNWVATDVDPGVVTANLKVASYNGSTWTPAALSTPSSTSITTTGLSSLGTYAVGELITTYNWTGATSTNWFTNGNWSTGLPPTTANDVVVPSGLTNYPVVSGNTASTKNLSIQSGGSVTVTNGLLRISGTITNSGSLLSTAGSIEMNGTSAQAISAGVFSTNTVLNLTINNTSGVTLGGTFKVTGILKVTSGQLNTGGYLTLVSTAAGTALIDGTGAGQVSGNVTMQRYLSSSFGYRYFSSPFQAATVNEFANEVDLNATYPVLYRYLENKASSGWTKYTTSSGVLNPLEGYAVNMGASTTPITVDMTGAVNNQTISATLFNNNQPYTLGFNLVGNPYPSPIDWDITGGWTRNNIDNAIYYFNAGATDRYTGTYSSYINGISSDGTANNIIPAMQGFFVHVSNGTYPVSGTLAVNNNARVNNISPSFHKERPNPAPLLRLSAGFTEEGLEADPLVIYLDAAATKSFDQEMDALKIMNTDPLVPNLFIPSPGGGDLSICAWPADNKDTIPLGLITERAGMIVFHMVNMDRIPADRHFFLYDAITGAIGEVNEQLQFRVYLSPGHFKNRFYLVADAKDGPPATGSSAIFQAYNTHGELYGFFDKVPGEHCRIAVTNILGQTILQKDFSGNGHHLLGSNLTNGIYIVSFYTQQQTVAKKVFFYK
ncbi:T9SS type A sorting domain-containing protein [Chitinophaga sancti]|uniref:T9SS type A sorting domain-containing protein n=1 Tax=Chitinophaga sancti TaxID=1004 RepID=A0A1K1RXH1_9BACT|nr:T9SS type A sorting domain-containing protein [Chitinophaga sancti]WQD64017.1 T9SS type A sorting domain-containing protein [Chitinophaga sancti]WQG90359.1 T9SS type A sorting domain-containing protein [Chitinophaga sancti]SFW76532.1 hypothetical protein SAMN05661012_04371 [Chitinophaga sancti]